MGALGNTLLSGLGLLVLGPSPRPRDEDAGLELSYLANEGFLLRAGESAVLIDAFVEEPYGSYAALEPEVRERLLAGRPPFDSIDLALTSHLHPDHFQPSLACAFLAAHPDCPFVSSEDVLARLRTVCEPEAERLVSVLPATGESVTRTVGGIEVTFLRLSHGTGRFASVQNLGHVITLGGQRVLHLGDADMAPEHFAPYAELLRGERPLDLALVPYWYFSHPVGKAFVRERLHARHVVAIHVPPEELPQTRRLLEARFPDVVLFERSLETRRFAPAEASPTGGEAPR